MQTRYKMQKVDCRLRKKRRLRRKIVFFFSHQYNNLHIVTQLLFHGHLPWKFRKHVFVLEMGQKHYIIMYKSGRLKSQHCASFEVVTAVFSSERMMLRWLQIGDGKHMTPALSCIGGFMSFRASP